jgi:hypothetical protein
MHINVEILNEKLVEFIQSRYVGADKELLLRLTKVVLFNNPSQNCVIKGAKSGWDGLPKDKSLFYSPVKCGLPIGNLSSQVFAFSIKHELLPWHYGPPQHIPASQNYGEQEGTRLVALCLC